MNRIFPHSKFSNTISFPTHAPPASSLSATSPQCVIYDEVGSHRLMSSDPVLKSLLEKHDLLPRDLRKIDKGGDDIVPMLILRDQSILLSVLHVRALIKSNEVALFNYNGTYSSTHLVQQLSEKLRPVEGANNNKAKIKKDVDCCNDDCKDIDTPSANTVLDYEIRALECIFADVIDHLQSEMKVHVTVINGILKELEDDVDLAKLKYLLIVSKKLQVFMQKATLIRDLLDEMLDQDETLNDLYLTERKLGIHRCKDDHQEVELLLESYALHCDAIVQTVERRVNDVKTTEEVINIVLDSNRNDLMLLNLKFSITLFSLASLLFFAAVYGMNLENFIEEREDWFFIVCGGCFVVSFVIFGLANRKLIRLQKVQLNN
ncbi:Mfm1 protein [Martiniozyma asiatica (nom. inval.)]|nr:Mfm1 protein [Martiniozyma asiatica]